MEASEELAVTPARRYIIERPRLTRLLDESKSRIIMLVAPAGYGKTTLAQQWLEHRPHGWYRGTTASADVAALCVGLADVVQHLVPGAGTRMRERLKVTRNPEADARPLAELLAEDLSEWPAGAWLAIDDYQFAMESEASEVFMDVVTSSSPVHLLLASRRRPSWATARRLIYRDIHEVDRAPLAMDPAEATAVLGDARVTSPAELLAQAEGWPAVIGLAAHTAPTVVSSNELPATLYAFLADELYRTARPPTQRVLRRLAVVPSITQEVAVLVSDEGSAEANLREAVVLGLLTEGPRKSYELHPLVRTFLRLKLEEESDSDKAYTAAMVGDFLIRNGRWDEAFEIAQVAADQDLFERLLLEALPRLVEASRVATVAAWVRHATESGWSSGVIDVAEAEVAVMKGETTKAEVLALEGATRLGENHTLFSHAHYLAGLSAHLGNREEAAFRHHEIAVSSAQDSVDELKARWGRFVVASTLERDETRVLLDELLASAVDAPDEAFLRCFSNLMYEFRLGSIATTRGLIVEGFSLVDRIRDPIMVSSFLQISTAATVLSGNYAHASELVTRQFAHIGAFRLDFAEPHAHLNRAGVQMGLRQFNSAVTSLATAERLAHASDPLMDINVALARARLAVTVGDRSGALTHLGTAPDSGCNVGIQSEYLATLGLVNACSGNYRTALNLAQEASSLSSQSETRVLAPCIRAIVAIGDCGADAPADASSALAAALEIGNLDSFICACRAFPGLLRSLASHPESQPALQAMFSRSSDVKLASSAGLRTATPLDGWAGLSAREQEVYGLLAQGLTNREIAQTLYISEVTAKVHVRHILGKLGVRSRTEAAIRAITQEKG